MSAWKTKATKGGGDFEKAPPGNHPAVLVGMFDMGTQEQEFQGEVKEQHRVLWVWELVTEKTKAGGNHLIGIDLTFSLNDKAKMRAFIEARLNRPLGDGEDYDISAELGQPCFLNVVEKNGYPKVAGVGAVPKGITVGKPTHAPTTWSLDEFEKTGQIILPPWTPYLYGEPLSAHISRCLELSGKEVKPADPAPVSAAPANRPSPPSTRPAPPNQAAAPPANKFWIDLGGGQMNDEPLDAAAAGHLLQSKGLTDQTMVCVDGSQEWKTAQSFGIKTAF